MRHVCHTCTITTATAVGDTIDASRDICLSRHIPGCSCCVLGEKTGNMLADNGDPNHHNHR